MMTEAVPVMPRVTLKLATSLDGRIATRSGASKWITGPQARMRVHKMRAAHDCVLTGIGTVLADDPELTARLDPPLPKQPLRAVLDSYARIPVTSKLLQTADLGQICLFHQGVGRTSVPVVTQANVHTQLVKGSDDPAGGLNLRDVLMALQARFDVKTIMVEAGARVATAFLAAGLVDRLVWFRAPKLIGGDGLAAVSSLGIDALSDAITLETLDSEQIGLDRVETYRVIRT
jgi:diaminohydroxyphosphoribosylaminopyrimidine deaminase / 5-amino-6-(5-phosphoribosylamino)uracil reductase